MLKDSWRSIQDSLEAEIIYTFAARRNISFVSENKETKDIKKKKKRETS